MGAKRTMGALRKPTTRAVASKSGRKKAAARPAPKKPTKRRSTASTQTRTSRPTIATVSAQLEALRDQVAALTELVRAQGHHDSPPPRGSKTNGSGHHPELDRGAFDTELLDIVAELDRGARHAGLIPIPEVRNVFLERGWSRSEFDTRLLEAERDFIVDLKSANDPARLAEPDLAIQQPGRGYLQYVVTR